MRQARRYARRDTRRLATVTAGALLALTASMGSATSAVAAGAAGGAGVADGPKMPDFRGRGLIHVFSGVDYRTKVEVRDVGGDHRNVLWPLSWKVCAQSPDEGKEIGDRTVRIGVVKNNEKCPKGASV
ncbi:MULTISPECIES: hypothetical protein [unclassified Streptomyces]|uniref:hypothetical protein n=1 Tax=unclassified Streptomyces TaxID=2593676 RepID=UPI00278BD1CD|nr:MULTISPECIES: hypothetical protein [unclassified Streptomyces]